MLFMVWSHTTGCCISGDSNFSTALAPYLLFSLLLFIALPGNGWVWVTIRALYDLYDYFE